MRVSAYQWKKWIGRYLLHSKNSLHQGVGQFYRVDTIAGYYNDLRDKVTKGEKLAPDELPQYYQDTGKKFCFSIGIMQYGLACYDLFLSLRNTEYRDKMLLCADWAVNAQKENGGWDTFDHLYPEHPYSAMAQGEGVSLLLRAYQETSLDKYMAAAEKAAFFMLVPIENGGVAIVDQDKLVLMEYTERPIVLNGWIFALWGLFDYAKATGNAVIQEAYERSLATLEAYIPRFDLGYWTRYDYSERIASPFYHDLVIDQFRVMHDITGHAIFLDYMERFVSYRDNPLYRFKAFVIKATQKLRGK